MESAVIKADSYENYLLVEGDEDKHVFTQLMGQYEIFEKFKIKQENFEIKGHNGIEYLLNLRTLRNYFVVDESRRFGIVIDADIDLAARWKQIKAICETIGYHTQVKLAFTPGLPGRKTPVRRLECLLINVTSMLMHHMRYNSLPGFANYLILSQHRMGIPSSNLTILLTSWRNMIEGSHRWT